LDNLLELGTVEESDSPWASPIVLVPTSDGTMRLCTDFRKVNAVTVPDFFHTQGGRSNTGQKGRWTIRP